MALGGEWGIKRLPVGQVRDPDPAGQSRVQLLDGGTSRNDVGGAAACFVGHKWSYSIVAVDLPKRSFRDLVA